jgi:thioredoxin reductase/ferredoxin
VDLSAYIVYGLPLAAVVVWHLSRRRRGEQRSIDALQERRASGHVEPASLHPVIDAVRCIGCGSCVKACPEQPEHHVLGLIQGKAQLISPGDCIGHGACRAACPVDAISLVFGSEKRGVDIPLLTPRFETNVAGVFIAGELGGMGLIRNALEQGRQAVEAVHQQRPRGGGRLDLVIVGAGPAGFAASLTALSRRMKFVTLEQESLGGCVFQYPRGKLVMTQPATLPLVGKVKLSQTSKEELLEFWRSIERRTGVEIHYRERVEAVERDGDGFIVRTPRGEYRTHSVLLAIGRRGTPQKLNVPGEDRPKVVYRLIDPEQYAGQHILVVGGGDSALEAAASIAQMEGAHVTLSYRGEAFTRAKPANRERIDQAERSGRLQVLLQSTVQRIEDRFVALMHRERPVEVANEGVIISAGGTLPTDFLRRIGVAVETKYGSA